MTSGPHALGDDGEVVAHLLFVELLRFPWLRLFERLGFDGFAALRFVVIFEAAAAGGAFGVGIHQHAAAGAAQRVADVEGHAVGADHGKTRPVTEGDGIVAGDEDGVEHRADDARIAVRRDADAGRKAGVDGELRSVFAGDEQAALLDEFLEVLEAVVAEAGAHVGGRVDAAEVRRQVRLLPRQRVVPHGQAVDDVVRRGAADGSEDDDVVFRAQVVFFRDGLRADVVEGDALGVEGIAPPAFGLRGEPGMHEGDARRGNGVHGDGGR